MESPNKPLLLYRSAALAVLALACFVAPLRADDLMGQPAAPAETEHLHYLAAGKPDVTELLAPPPLPDSPEQAADLNTVREVSRATDSNDMAMALSESKFSVFTFGPVVGPFFQANALPATMSFFRHVQSDAEKVTDGSKNYFKRPRPYTIDRTLASGKLEKSFSYPSGHSTESMVLALVLAEVFPEKREAIVAKARQIGWHRVEIARHYPTDIYAGRVLAQAIVREMNKDHRFQRDLAAAKAEAASAMRAASQAPAPLAAAH